MNASTEYELFTREVYRQLSAHHNTFFTKAQHNIKLKGRSGCEHQIDVYLEYVKDDILHRVAIECKNYNKAVPKEKVSAFYGIISDLDNVKGIMVSKKGFQKGAKQFAEHYGISLRELRSPNEGETIIGNIDLRLYVEKTSMLFRVDEQWAEEHGINIPEYKRRMDMISTEDNRRWCTATHIPLTITDDVVQTAKGDHIISLESIRDTIKDYPYVLPFQDGYINTKPWGKIKILEVKFDHNAENIQRNITIDAKGLVKAILKDVINDNRPIGHFAG